MKVEPTVRELKIIVAMFAFMIFIAIFISERHTDMMNRIIFSNSEKEIKSTMPVVTKEETEKDILILGLEKPRVDPLTRVIVEAKTSEDERALLMRTLHAEARGVEDREEKEAVIWTVLNRVDSKNHPNSIKEVIEEDFAFTVSESTPEVWEEIEKEELDIVVYNVLYAWITEKEYYDERRVLERGFCHFYGDGERNYFYKIGKDGLDFWPVEPSEEIQVECLSILLGER